MSKDEHISFKVSKELDKKRLDSALAMEVTDLSRTRIKQLILDGHCHVNDILYSDPSAKVRFGSNVTLVIPAPVDAHPIAENIDIDIVYEDEHLLIVNKQAGLTVHPGAGQKNGTLVNALLYHCKDKLSSIGGVIRPGIVHRLDKDTSGLMVVAKTDQAHQGLTAQLADRSLKRLYIGFMWDIFALPSGSIDKPIARHISQRTKMAVGGRLAKEAVTHYKVLQTYGVTAQKIECRLQTGRTHQIRVHMTHANHPLIGDKVYQVEKTKMQSLVNKGGYKEDMDFLIGFPRQALHAYHIGFEHPATGDYLEKKIDLPADLLKLEGVLSANIK